VSKTASLGTQTGSAQKLNPSQRDALMGMLREQIERCYQAPISASAGDATPPVLDIRLNQDGSLSTEPAVLRVGASTTDRAVADAALRAVRRCAPFRVPAQFAPYYSDWKTLNVQFDLS
jgi:colicin import membrane protein